MKLLRFGAPGQERPGVLASDGTVRDASALATDYDGAFFAGDGIAALRAADLDALPAVPDDVRIGAPIPRPQKIVCIGLNYADHAAEAGFPVPKEPMVFLKAPNTLVGPNDEVLVPPGAERVDWEVELAVVIGSRARYLPDERAALDAIAGFALVNDLSERAYQLDRGGEWTKGKSCETFNPLGPWLVTPDEIEDVQSLPMWLDVNGERMQTSNTSNMVWGAAHLVWYLSQFMVLEPGDLIDTGTPGGVGNLQDPPRFLRAGDVVELGIDGLGAQRLTVAPAVVEA
jgi:2,4-didehydro-3-deoxy-L-rhamnonate hydrolase